VEAWPALMMTPPCDATRCDAIKQGDRRGGGRGGEEETRGKMERKDDGERGDEGIVEIGWR